MSGTTVRSVSGDLVSGATVGECEWWCGELCHCWGV